MPVVDPLRVALVGIGGYGQIYTRILLEDAAAYDVEFIAAIDPQPERSALWEPLQEAGIPVYADLGQFFQRSAADLVVVSAPIHLHSPFTRQALAKGAAVLCEKPLAGSWQDGVAMFAAARKRDLPVAIGYQWSFDPAIQALKRDILAGFLGRPKRLKTMVLWSRPLSYYQRNNWAGRLQMPDGAWVLDSPVNNATAHYLHNMLYLLGDRRETSAWPRQIQAEKYRANQIENYDAAALRLWTEDGVEVLFYTAHPVVGDTGPWMEYEFERATVKYHAGERPSFVARFPDGEEKDYHGPSTGHTEKLWDVVAALRLGSPFACGIEAALPHLLCVHGAQHSGLVHDIPASHKYVEEMGSDRLIWVADLAQVFRHAFEHGLLPSETGMAAWTAAGGMVDLWEERQAAFPAS
jgi:predicted dehydrogenase